MSVFLRDFTFLQLFSFYINSLPITIIFFSVISYNIFCFMNTEATPYIYLEFISYCIPCFHDFNFTSRDVRRRPSVRPTVNISSETTSLNLMGFAWDNH